MQKHGEALQANQQRFGIIIVTRHGPEHYTAHVDGNGGVYASGKDAKDAIGDLWLTQHVEVEATIRKPGEAAIDFIRRMVQFPGGILHTPRDILEQAKSLLAKIGQ